MIARPSASASQRRRLLLGTAAAPWVWASVAAGIATGCTPALNWRVVQDPDGFWKVLFPAKPAEFERQVKLPQGPEVRLQLWAVRLEALQLSVGVAQPPAGQRWTPQQHAEVAQALRHARLATIQQAGPAEPGQADGSVPAALGGLRFPRLLAAGQIPADAQGRMTPARVWAEYRVFPQRVVEAVAVGPDTPSSLAVAEEFLASFGAGS